MLAKPVPEGSLTWSQLRITGDSQDAHVPFSMLYFHRPQFRALFNPAGIREEKLCRKTQHLSSFILRTILLHTDEPSPEDGDIVHFPRILKWQGLLTAAVQQETAQQKGQTILSPNKPRLLKCNYHTGGPKPLLPTACIRLLLSQL